MGIEPSQSPMPASGALPRDAASSRRRGDRAGYAKTLTWIAARAEAFARSRGVPVEAAFAQACVMRFHRRSHHIGGGDDLAAWVDELIGFEFRMKWVRTARANAIQQTTVH